MAKNYKWSRKGLNDLFHKLCFNKKFIIRRCSRKNNIVNFLFFILFNILFGPNFFINFICGKTWRVRLVHYGKYLMKISF